MRALGGSVNAISLVSVSSLPCPVFVWSEAKADEVKMEHAMRQRQPVDSDCQLTR